MIKKDSNNYWSEKDIKQINKYLDVIEEKIGALRSVLNKDTQKNKIYRDTNTRVAVNFVEGVFDGQMMIDEQGKKYIVPENYASKTKLVCGDKMKLVISDDGTFIFKLIDAVERKRVKGEFYRDEQEMYVLIQDKKYKILKASAIYFKLKTGDNLSLLLPKEQKSDWAVVENKIE